MSSDTIRVIQQAEYINLMKSGKYNISDSRPFTDLHGLRWNHAGDVTESGYGHFEDGLRGPGTEPSYGITEPESLAQITSKMDPSNFITRISSFPRWLLHQTGLDSYWRRSLISGPFLATHIIILPYCIYHITIFHCTMEGPRPKKS